MLQAFVQACDRLIDQFASAPLTWMAAMQGVTLSEWMRAVRTVPKAAKASKTEVQQWRDAGAKALHPVRA